MDRRDRETIFFVSAPGGLHASQFIGSVTETLRGINTQPQLRKRGQGEGFLRIVHGDCGDIIGEHCVTLLHQGRHERRFSMTRFADKKDRPEGCSYRAGMHDEKPPLVKQGTECRSEQVEAQHLVANPGSGSITISRPPSTR